jgi:hypothetical protein
MLCLHKPSFAGKSVTMSGLACMEMAENYRGREARFSHRRTGHEPGQRITEHRVNPSDLALLFDHSSHGRIDRYNIQSNSLIRYPTSARHRSIDEQIKRSFPHNREPALAQRIPPHSSFPEINSLPSRSESKI